MKISLYNKFKALLRIDEFETDIKKIEKAESWDYSRIIDDFEEKYEIPFKEISHLKRLRNTELEDSGYFNMVLKTESAINVIGSKEEARETKIGKLRKWERDKALNKTVTQKPDSLFLNDDLYMTTCGRYLQVAIDFTMPKGQIKAEFNDLVDIYYRGILGRGKSDTRDTPLTMDIWEVYDLHIKDGMKYIEIARKKSGKKGTAASDPTLKSLEKQAKRAYEKADSIILKIKKDIKYQKIYQKDYKNPE